MPITNLLQPPKCSGTRRSSYSTGNFGYSHDGKFIVNHHFGDHSLICRRSWSFARRLTVYWHHKNVNRFAFFVDDFLYGFVVVGGCEQVVGRGRSFWHIRLVLVIDDILDEGVEVVSPVERISEEKFGAGDHQEEANQAAECTQVPNYTPAFDRCGFIS